MGGDDQGYTGCACKQKKDIWSAQTISRRRRSRVESEAILADADAGPENDVVLQRGMTHGGVAADTALPPDDGVRPACMRVCVCVCACVRVCVCTCACVLMGYLHVRMRVVAAGWAHGKRAQSQRGCSVRTEQSQWSDPITQWPSMTAPAPMVTPSRITA